MKIRTVGTFLFFDKFSGHLYGLTICHGNSDSVEGGLTVKIRTGGTKENIGTFAMDIVIK